MDKLKLEDLVKKFEERLLKIKTGRANASMIEDLKVEVYGSIMFLKEVASISLPEPRQFLIKPYDKNNLKTIEKAISKADIGSYPSTEGDKIRLNLPPLTEENRKKEAVKVRQMMEETKIELRQLRHEFLEEVKELMSSEEEQERENKVVEEGIKEYNDKIEEIAKKKEEEVLNI